MVNIDPTSLDWAKDSLVKWGGSDIFPAPFEFKIIDSEWDNVKTNIIKISKYEWRGGRRFIVPLDDSSFRVITQLDPLDDLVLTALIHQYGPTLEKMRVKTTEKKVFSNRFDDADFTLYSKEINWNQFWNKSIENTKDNYVLVCDISDYYNQIYHHTLENQLNATGIPKKVSRWIRNFLMKLSNNVSRGIPVGPYTSHMLAEIALHPIDMNLKDYGYSYSRYVDDFHIFIKDEKEAQIAIYDLVEMLDDNGRLTMQRRKTRIFQPEVFHEYAKKMISENILPDEKLIVEVLTKHSSGDPYAKVPTTSLSKDELEIFSDEKICAILLKYMRESDPDYYKIRWFLRRLSQIGVPGAVKFIIEHLEEMLPVISDICTYLVSAKDQYDGDWKEVGGKILDCFDLELVKHCEYIRIVLLSLFSENDTLNHFPRLISLYSGSNEKMKRKIILTATKSDSPDWIRGRKDEIYVSDPWLKRSILYGFSTLPEDEKSHFVRSIKKESQNDILESAIIEWLL